MAVTKWLCELGVMARAKARAIIVYIYSYGASWLILWLPLAACWVRLVCDEVSVV